MRARMGATFGADNDPEHIGMDMMDFMMEMPLLSLLHFQQKDLPKPADELVDDLLRQAHGR